MKDCRLGGGSGIIGNRLYVAGGSDMMSGQFALNTVEWYDVATNSWRRANSMIHRRQGCCACVIDGLLYVLGGAGEDRQPTNSCEVYSPETDEWTEIATMELARQDAACVVVDGMIVVVGGSDGVQALDSCEVFDPSTGGEWSRIADMCERRQGCAAAVGADGSLFATGGMDYVVGGADADHQMRFLNTAEKFSKETHTWTLIEPMNLARREAAAVMVPLALIDPQEAARRLALTPYPTEELSALIGELFSVIDHNSDGMLDLEEVKACVPEGFEGQFMQHVDGNEDGKVSQEELTSGYLEALDGEPRAEVDEDLQKVRGEVEAYWAAKSE